MKPKEWRWVHWFRRRRKPVTFNMFALFDWNDNCIGEFSSWAEADIAQRANPGSTIWTRFH